MKKYTEEDLKEKAELLNSVEIDITTDSDEIQEHMDNDSIETLIIVYDADGFVYEGVSILWYLQNELPNNGNDFDQICEGYIAYSGDLSKQELFDLFKNLKFKIY